MRESPILRGILARFGALPVVRLFRNNVGTALYPDGSRVRYGLCPGSSDLIGWRSVTVTPDMVGKPVAVFTAIEVKRSHGHARKQAGQQPFVDAVRAAGGIAGFARSEAEAAALLGVDPP